MAESSISVLVIALSFRHGLRRPHCALQSQFQWQAYVFRQTVCPHVCRRTSLPLQGCESSKACPAIVSDFWCDFGHRQGTWWKANECSASTARSPTTFKPLNTVNLLD